MSDDTPNLRDELDRAEAALRDSEASAAALRRFLSWGPDGIRADDSGLHMEDCASLAPSDDGGDPDCDCGLMASVSAGRDLLARLEAAERDRDALAARVRDLERAMVQEGHTRCEAGDPPCPGCEALAGREVPVRSVRDRDDCLSRMRERMGALARELAEARAAVPRPCPRCKGRGAVLAAPEPEGKEDEA